MLDARRVAPAPRPVDQNPRRSSKPLMEVCAMKLLNLDITRIAHDTFRIAGSKVIYTDPYKVTKRDEADIVLLSHEHFDHLSLEDLEKVCFQGTTVLASPLCKDGLKKLKVKEIHFLDPGGKHRSEEHTSELQSLTNLVCRLLL